MFDCIDKNNTSLVAPGIRVHLPMQETQAWAAIQEDPSGFLVAQMVQRLPAMQQTWVRSLGQEDPLERGMATYSSILAWKIPCM